MSAQNISGKRMEYACLLLKDTDQSIADQTLPWNHRGWHCGSGSKGSGNNTHIGVELFAMLRGSVFL